MAFPAHGAAGERWLCLQLLGAAGGNTPLATGQGTWEERDTNPVFIPCSSSWRMVGSGDPAQGTGQLRALAQGLVGQCRVSVLLPHPFVGLFWEVLLPEHTHSSCSFTRALVPEAPAQPGGTRGQDQQHPALGSLRKATPCSGEPKGLENH